MNKRVVRYRLYESITVSGPIPIFAYCIQPGFRTDIQYPCFAGGSARQA
jgi:hypothetical protein